VSNPGARPKLLVVDDDPIALNIHERFFSVKGFTVVKARNGPEGVEAARAERPDVILLDIMMPAFDDGLEAARRIRAAPETATIPVIAFTGRGLPDERERALEAGCNDVEIKGGDLEMVLEKVRRHLPRGGEP
jgi:CheY-like chemotaxis protein